MSGSTALLRPPLIAWRRGAAEVAGFVLKRLGFAVFTLLAVLTLVFFIVRVLPGDPALVILGDQASMAAIDSLRERLGLDRTLLVQYIDFLRGVASGDWGVSMVTGRPVIQEILKALPATIELTVVSLVLGAVVGIPLGIWAAINRNALRDYLTRLGSLLGLSFPAFVSAIILLLVFAIQLRWFPVISSGQGDTLLARIRDLALPAINLGLIMAAYITRVTRCSMLEVLGQDYVRTAHAKGVPWRVIIWRHCLRNALIPRGHRGRALSRHPDRQLGADRDRLQPARVRQAYRRRLEPARLHHAAGDDGDLHVDRGRPEPAHRSELRLHRPPG